MPLDVRADHLEELRSILQRHVPDREVWAFGSRVTGKAKPVSDLDLCIVDQTPLSFEIAAQLRQALSDSNIPYPVDMVEWATASEAFRQVMQRDKIVVQAARSKM